MEYVLCSWTVSLLLQLATLTMKALVMAIIMCFVDRKRFETVSYSVPISHTQKLILM
jgi:hypothetical protein